MTPPTRIFWAPSILAPGPSSTLIWSNRRWTSGPSNDLSGADTHDSDAFNFDLRAELVVGQDTETGEGGGQEAAQRRTQARGADEHGVAVVLFGLAGEGAD